MLAGCLSLSDVPKLPGEERYPGPIMFVGSFWDSILSTEYKQWTCIIDVDGCQLILGA